MIRLQFVAQRGIVSDLIGWFGSGHFSHVDAVLADGSLLGARSDNVGGAPAGVQIRTPFYLPFARRAVFRVKSTDAQYMRWLDFLYAQMGKPYDRMAILGFITGRDWREDDRWICSELQMAALEYAGVSPHLFLADSKITPVAAALVTSAVGGSLQ